jgi:hypothetical protein
MKKYILLGFSLLYTVFSFGQDYDYMFRLTLKDKGATHYSIDKPEQFLSTKAIERRQKQGYKIDQSDFPISENYLAEIRQAGGIIVAKSKWLNTVSVLVSDSLLVNRLDSLPFVDSAMFIWRGTIYERPDKVTADSIPFYPMDVKPQDDYYGYAAVNIKTLNGDKLHAAGYKGNGVDVAVIDAGFSNLPSIEYLDSVNVGEYKNFVYNGDGYSIYNKINQHGLNSLSCMATNKPYKYVGTAPEASYFLYVSEDSRSEFPVEEDYWVSAIEHADSVGVDVVNTSLGYYKFDSPAISSTYAELDGKTRLISRAANKAVQKGMFLVCSAGNEGNGNWGKITSPADAFGVLTVGAMKMDSTIAPFSSKGYTADLRVKPDVVALGFYMPLVDDMGRIVLKSGTSFSSPTMCGLVACLWQAFPLLTNAELLDVIQRSSDRYDDPNEIFGYGIPDMEKAMQIAKGIVDNKGQNRIAASENFRIESDGIGLLRIIVLDENSEREYTISLVKKVKNRTLTVLSDKFRGNKYEAKIKANSKGVYHVTIESGDVKDTLQIYF